MPSPRPGGGGPAGGPGGGGSQDGGPSDPGGGPGGGEPGGGAGSTGASGPGGAAGPDGGRVARLRRRAEAVRERAGAGLEAARRRSRAVDTAFLAYERDRQAVGGVLAGAVAFRLFVYTLPLVLGALTLLGTLRSIDPDHPRALGHDLGMSAYVIDSVAAAAEQSQRGIWLLVPLAAWAVYSGGLGVVRVMRAVHALAWGQPVTRPASNLTAALAAFGLAVAAFALVGSLQALRERSEGLGLGLALLGFAPFAGLWLVTSLLMPRDPAARWTALVPGAVLVGVAAWGAHLASVYYLARRVQKASELYGSLGVAAAILAWLYLLGRVMVGSAMLDAALWHRGRARREG